ncbi:MAG: response regulator transcription factor [Solobacterium sp.]|nr:response regulator transcription factor [Solobacterium sp.]
MIIRCALIDDKKNDIQIIKNTLFQLCHGSDTIIQIKSFQNPADAGILDYFDMYIVDVDMPDVNGFQLANQIYEKYARAIIVFCTLHENLVYDSFRLNAFYFVRKSNLEEDLTYFLKKYLAYRTNNTYIAKTAGGIEKIPFEQIIYFEVSHNDMYIHLADSTEIRERKSMQKLSAELSSVGFVQIGKSFLVNMSHIQKITEYKAILSNTQSLSIPKTQYSTVCKMFLMYSSR